MTTTRTSLPRRRESQSYQLSIRRRDTGDRYFCHVTLSPYPGGKLGEVWVDFGQQGSTLSVAMSAWAIALSQALQHGCHPRRLANTFANIREWPGEDEETGQEVVSLYDAIAQLIAQETDEEGRLKQ